MNGKFRFLMLPTLLLFVSITNLIGAESNTQNYADENREPAHLQEKAAKIFLDVPGYYKDYIKTEIPFVNYVRDRKLAQVHIMMTSQRTGSGGNEYTFTFTGLKKYSALSDTLKYVSRQMDTRDMTRQGIVKTLKLGLVPYIAKTPQAKYLQIYYRVKSNPTDVNDRWDFWVFNINTDGNLDLEESKKNYRLGGSLSADRVTPNWKISFSLNTRYNETSIETSEGSISSITRSPGFMGLIVKSLGEHWSAGGYASARSSVYSNLNYSYGFAPAIEFNVFPYSISTRKEFRFLYRLGYTNVHYNEETIFDKTSEVLFSESLSATLEIKEKWGSTSTTLRGSHFFHDFSKNNLQMSGNLNIRLFEGISIDLSGSISRVHDQLSLPKKDATLEEVLLRRKQLASEWEVSTRIGLRYTFGSIYSNVVNPRFGSTGRHRRRYY